MSKTTQENKAKKAKETKVEEIVKTDDTQKAVDEVIETT